MRFRGEQDSDNFLHAGREIMSISIACLMPTIASHARFRPVAEKCFAAQVYPNDWKVDLLVDEHETDSLGKKLNRMVASVDGAPLRVAGL